MTTTTLSLQGDNVWRIEGELTFSSVNALLKQSKGLWRDNQDILVDLSKVTHADSAALALLLEWKRVAKKLKKEIEFQHLPKQLKSLVEISHISTMI